MTDSERRAAMEPASTLPLVRLALIMPFVEELDREGLDTDAVLMRNGLARETVRDPGVFVPVIVIHRFLEESARAASDPYLGVHVGERLDLGSWSPFVEGVSRAATVVEFLIHFIESAKDDASSARHQLDIGPIYAHFREKRTTEQEMAPAQNDAFTAALVLRLLRLGTGECWKPNKVRLTVCDPEALPQHYLGVSIIGGDRDGIVVRFPTSWLLPPLDREGMTRDVAQREGRLSIPIDFANGVRQILNVHLHQPDLGVDLVARLSGLSRQSLQRRLKASGTTLSAEISALKKRRACEQLMETGRPVTEVATALGYTDPTSFARAFKSWTGESPRQFRRTRKSEVHG